MHRRLVSHGFLLFVVSLLVGVAVPSFANPRMALSAHVGGLMSGLFLIGLGAVWSALTLTPGRAAAIYWLALYGMWVGTVALVLAAIFGTGSFTPIAGAGRAGTPWQEALVVLTLIPSAVAAVACCVLVLLALREP